MKELQKGTIIKFNSNLYAEANEDHPTLLLARKNEFGKILNKSEFSYEYKVETKDKNPFYCNSNEFEVVKCKEKNCTKNAVIDYNGVLHFVCQDHYDSLTRYFEEEYK